MSKLFHVSADELLNLAPPMPTRDNLLHMVSIKLITKNIEITGSVFDTRRIVDLEPIICQSCAMPLTGEPHKEYCDYCFENGGFIEPNLTLKEAIEVNIPYIIKYTDCEDEESARKLLQDELPKLKRWK